MTATSTPGGGTYHYADRDGVGVERSDRGTGFVSQYPKYWHDVYDDLSSCPDELLLFFHHVPYGHRLKSGKTVIQHIYDSHFWGVEQVQGMVEKWKSLKDLVDPETFEEVSKRMEMQLRNAVEWRDQVNTYFFRKSGVPDAMGRKIYP